MPANIFMIIKVILEQTETKAALVFLVMGRPYSRWNIFTNRAG